MQKLNETLNLNNINLSVLFLIYPNPTKSSAILKIENPSNEVYALTLFTSSGEIVQTIKNITSNEIKIERQNLPSGIYYFQLKSEKQFHSMGKLIFD